MPTGRHLPSAPSIQGPTVPSPQPMGLAPALERNIQAMVRRRTEEAAAEGHQDKLAQAITNFSGSMTFVYLHLLIVGGWIVINLGWVPFAAPWDPSLVILAMIASVEAIFLSTFVLMSQNRMSRADDRRADLNLQISLLAEHETTKLVELVAAIAEKLQVEVSTRPEEIRELEQDVAPEAVLDRIEQSKPD